MSKFSIVGVVDGKKRKFTIEAANKEHALELASQNGVEVKAVTLAESLSEPEPETEPLFTEYADGRKRRSLKWIVIAVCSIPVVLMLIAGLASLVSENEVVSHTKQFVPQTFKHPEFVKIYSRTTEKLSLIHI